jgi:hypothetical protein
MMKRGPGTARGGMSPSPAAADDRGTPSRLGETGIAIVVRRICVWTVSIVGGWTEILSKAARSIEIIGYFGFVLTAGNL